MAQHHVRIIMNGVTGRMGYRQHLLRSILAIREEGGRRAARRPRLQVEPILVGRDAASWPSWPSSTASPTGPPTSTSALADDRAYRSTSTPRSPPSARRRSSRRSPPASTSTPRSRRRDGRRGPWSWPRRRAPPASTTVSCTTSSTCRACSSSRLVDGGFFGRILSVRGEFGYWVFEGDCCRPSGPSWNYRAADGGGIVVDMFCHWNYVLREPHRPGPGGDRQGRHPHPRALGREGRAVRGDRRRRRLRDLRTRGGIVAQINSSWACASTATSWWSSRSTAPTAARSPGCAGARSSPAPRTPKPVWNPDLPTDRGLPRPVAGGARQPGVRQRLQGAVGAVPARRRTPAWPHPYDLVAGGARAASSSRLGCAPRPRAAGRRCEIAPDAGASVAVPPPPTGRWRAGHAARRRRRGPPTREPYASRIAFAAAHVVADPLADNVPGAPAVLDWDATLAFRRHLFRTGLGVAEAMDTAQRGMGLDWPAARSWSSAAPPRPARAARGSPPGSGPTSGGALPHARRGHRAPTTSSSRSSSPPGSQVILMASRDLAARRPRTPTTTSRCTPGCSSRWREPVILHWLGEMFDPELAGYWGYADVDDRHRVLPRARRASTPTGSTASRCRCSRRRPRGRAARGAAGRGAALHRRRLQLPRADPRRRRRPLRRPARHLRRGRPRGLRRSGRARRRRPRRVRRGAGPDGGAVAARVRRADAPLQDRASCSWPGSTGTRTASPWSAACSRRAAPCTSGEVFALADGPAAARPRAGRRTGCALLEVAGGR